MYGKTHNNNNKRFESKWSGPLVDNNRQLTAGILGTKMSFYSLACISWIFSCDTKIKINSKLNNKRWWRNL